MAHTSLTPDNLTWITSPSLNGRADHFIQQNVQTGKILKSWKTSLFSFEWLDADGMIKPLHDLKDSDQQKRRTVLENLKSAAPLEIPVLGLGMSDNIEIGAGKAVFLTLCAAGYDVLPVYVPKSCLEHFKTYLA